MDRRTADELALDSSQDAYTLTFERIYRSNAWRGAESRSGPGSSRLATHRLLSALDLIVRAIEPQSVINVGCGDDLWTPQLPGYLGVDIAPTAIRRAKAHHPERRYRRRDARTLSRLPVFDLAICRDALQHVPAADALSIIEQCRQHSRWMLLSTYLGTLNVDIAEGDFYSPDLTAAPFSLPVPELLIFDGWDYGIDGQVRDPAKYLGLWRSG